MGLPGNVLEVELDKSALVCEDAAGGGECLCTGDENSEHGPVDIEREE